MVADTVLIFVHLILCIFDETIRRAKNIEPNFCWECYSCVKACPNHAIDVRGYADFAPMGHSVRVRREEEKGTISWKNKI